MVLPNAPGTRVDLHVLLGSTNERAVVALYKVTLRTLSSAGVSERRGDRVASSPGSRHVLNVASREWSWRIAHNVSRACKLGGERYRACAY